ncbi:MAG: TetR/AcrR family transcriptional regulator [Pseudomonadales bacterium]|nr:TetR/AcrR family transcriptional regulator [Pseudomonadales bacterium]
MNSTVNGTRADTKRNLILSALDLFAREGIDAVSMRTINSAAGARNASAVHYHFGNKLGIIEAIISFIKEELDGHRLPMLEALEARQGTDAPPGCREVMWAVFRPYIQLNKTPGYGRSAIRFLARLQTDMNAEIQALLNRDPHEIAQRIDSQLAHALPSLPADVRRTRYMYSWTLMVQGFAGTGSWETTAFGNLRAPSGDAALMRFFDYLVGGMEAPVTHP